MPNLGERPVMSGRCAGAGCGRYPVPLYRVFLGLERFRCAECVDKERETIDEEAE